RFEDYFMDYVVSVCKDSTSLESIIPRGLIQLKRYDEKYETNMLHILSVFLKHDMRIASAARELFLHRNTLTAKISQIKFITRMDFEGDPEVRLQTLVALYMMEA
ncbi:MAG: helix-turn-helix domain-containing protein, partial [Coriobacteriia bacterium]|nr:helix-turn-helix domain-containing protein [Coriobacteriia bacterium]